MNTKNITANIEVLSFIIEISNCEDALFKGMF